jgi:hypothetical protein
MTMEIKCEDVRKNIKDYTEHRLEPRLMGQIEQHIFDCSDCLLYYVAETQWEPEVRKIPA